MRSVLRRQQPDATGHSSPNYDLLVCTDDGEQRVATIYKKFWPRRRKRNWLVEMASFYYRSECPTLKAARVDAQTQFSRRASGVSASAA